jgi:LCP family protein required for cell wall assembly
MITNVVNTPQGGGPDESSQMPTGGRPPRRPLPPKKRRGGRGRRAFAVVSVLLLGAVALAVGKGFSTLRTMGGGKVGVTDILSSIKDPRGKFPGKDRVNILVIGRDYNRDSKGMPYTKGSRADSIMLISLNMSGEAVSALSIPRDTWVTAADGETGKINATLTRGGPKLLCDTVGELLGVRPDYYIALKPDAVRAVVDELGGVEVETLDQMEYNDWWGKLFVKLPAGRQRINGEQAIGFTRFREADVVKRNPDGSPVLGPDNQPLRKRASEVVHSKEEGDPRRVARQQQLIRAMIAEGKKPQNLLRIGEVIDTGFAQIETDLKRDQVFALAALFKGTQPDQMQSGQLVGRPTMRRTIYGRTYTFEPDREKARYLVDWLLRGDEEAANHLTVVAVQNGTKVPGAARKVADLLQEKGFDAHSAGNAPRPAAPAESAPVGTPSPAAPGETGVTLVTYRKASVAARAQRIAALLGAKSVVKDTSAPSPSDGDEDAPADVTVVLGLDVAASFSPQRSARL